MERNSSPSGSSANQPLGEGSGVRHQASPTSVRWTSAVGHQQRPADRIVPHQEGEQPGDRRHEKEGGDHGATSRRLVSRSASM